MARRRVSTTEGKADSELNLVPYLDIMMNLIMFMLLTFQVAPNLNVIDFDPYGNSGDGPASVGPMLTLMVAQDGFHLVAGDRDVLVPRVAGELDFAALTDAASRLKRAVPDAQMVLVAEADVPYQTVVQTLDATREDAAGNLLFPKVTMGMATGI